MTSAMTQIASDLNEKVDNRYELVLEISDLAKQLFADLSKKNNDPFSTDSGATTEKVIYQALIMKASEVDMGDGLIG